MVTETLTYEAKQKYNILSYKNKMFQSLRWVSNERLLILNNIFRKNFFLLKFGHKIYDFYIHIYFGHNEHFPFYWYSGI